MSNLQALMDGWSAQWQRERSETQMTLGELIQALESLPADAKIQGVNSPHSYRGYYSDLAFEPMEGMATAADLLKDCRGSMGVVFTGYKGGEYMMGQNTPVWIAEYGCCGLKIMGINPDGSFATAEDD